MAAQLVIAGVSAAIGLASSLFGASQASSANDQAQRNYEEQVKAAEETAKKTNEYNKKAFGVEILNYERNAAYNWETALQTYDYNVKRQDYQEAQAMKAYEADQGRIAGQKTANAWAATQGAESEQRALEQVRIGNAFEMQNAMVSQLRAMGTASLGQAGKSTQRSINSTLAELGREIGVMDASLKAAVTDTNMNLINQMGEYYFANKNLDLTAMLMPEALPDIPEPIKPPDPIWLEPMEVEPNAISPPIKQDVGAMVVQGAFNAASAGLGAFANYKNNNPG
jgi:hypothetical protein